MRLAFLSILLLALLLAACTSSVEESPGPTPADPTATVVAREEEPTEAPAEMTEAPKDAATATVTQEAQVAEQSTAKAEPSPIAPPEPTETSAPAFNGEYEGTYFRGLATAPITMIDYSDFL